ncbi:argininosuccinate lyase [Aquipseudomonas campi]
MKSEAQLRSAPSRLPHRLARLALVTLTLAASLEVARAAEPHDYFHYLGEMNKASTVVVIENKIVPADLGRKIVAAVDQVIKDGDKPGAERPADYLDYEPLILKLAGPDGSRMHSGRSRQDILSTTRRLMQRERVLSLLDAMNQSRGAFLQLAGENLDTIVPAYTNGVQAQPTTYAHYLLAFNAVFERDTERLHQAYARLNLSPLGAAALGTSSFPVDRKRLADLLGFDGPVENSYDAAQLGALDTGMELTGISANAAQTIGLLVEDMHIQYHQPYPWIMIREGRLTGTSSIMPQKRNPYVLNRLRLLSSGVLGGAVTYQFESHNVSPGMPDYKRDQVERTLDMTTESFVMLTDMLGNLIIDKTRALQEVDADYSTSTELADILQRDADVPFRVGHHFASELVSYGRANKVKPADIPYDQVKRIYAEALKASGMQHAEFPLSLAQYQKGLSAKNMLDSSLGLGGPQHGEVERMLKGGRERLERDQAWLSQQRGKLASASAKLDKTFYSLGR